MAVRKKYAQIGLGGRARFFYEAIASDYKDTSELVAFCDINQTRMDYANKVLKEEYNIAPVPTYSVDLFDEMIKKEKPDYVLVTSIDRTHHKYIVRAMELGCDVISEKPMTTDAEKAQYILDAIKRTGRNLRVTFNYRYAPHNTKIRELIMNGAIGDVFSVHFEWLLNTKHGADYFRRWHRDKRNSGGLLVHKSTHHFDLVNFWLGTQPKTVFSMGDLRFYGRENAENRGVTKFYNRAHGSKIAKNDPFALDLEENEKLKAMYLDAEKEDGYFRDQSVFGDGGGLLVHKSTHHFDLVNFWLGTQPKTVFSMGDLRFYGRENAENRGVTQFYNRAHGSKYAKDDPFALNLEENETLKAMYLNAEKEDGYFRDQSVFGDGINIEDTMG
ncbi:MAG TPA: Gfo/Idh/MocA family oxidoreductase, partial [Thermoclostridium sp.]|nr:Gfo/Idh/MocA family oxidoreductase [Thermoclostridium sp.]